MIPLDQIRIDGYKLDANLSNNLKPESDVVRSMEGAPTIRLVVHDPERELLETGVLIKPHRARKALRGTSWESRLGRTRLAIGGRFYAMAGLDKASSDITLSFEGEISSRLRHRYKPVSARRGRYTRAEFIKNKLILPSRPRTIVWAPSLDERQPVQEVEPERVKRGVRVHTGLTVKDVPIDRQQAEDINILLRRADKADARVRPRLAMMVAAIAESNIRRIMNQGDPPSPYGGVLQGNVGGGVFELGDTAGMADCFMLGGKGYQGGGAIKLAREHPDWEPGRIALTVLGSISNFGGDVARGTQFYQGHIEEAEEILNAYGTGLADDGGATVEKRERQMYRAGGKKGTDEEENYLAAIERLIRNEVNWRAFEDDNIFFLAHDLDFLKSTPRVMIAEECDRRERQIGVIEVGNIDFAFHLADESVRATFKAPAEAWYGWPGSPIEVIRCGPITGKQLMWEFRQPILSSLADITLHRPALPLKEPAPVVNRVSTTDVGAVPTKTGELIYPLAVHGTFNGGVAAHKARPMHNWMSDNAVDINVPMGTKVFAVDDGTILAPLSGSWNGGAGNPDGFNVYLQTADNTWFYTHLRSRRPLQVGDRVQAGQLLGESGAGNGVPHLHIGSLRGDPQILLGV